MTEPGRAIAAVSLTPDGFNAWYADVEIEGLLIYMLPVSGETDNEAMFEVKRWLEKNRKSLQAAREQLLVEGELQSSMLVLHSGRAEIRPRRR